MKRRPGLVFYALIDPSTAVRKVEKRGLGDVFIAQEHRSTKVLYSAHALEGSESTIAGFLHDSVQAIYKGMQIFQARGLSRTVAGDIMGLPAARVNARSGRVCMFVCANVHAPFLGKAPYGAGPKNKTWRFFLFFSAHWPSATVR